MSRRRSTKRKRGDELDMEDYDASWPAYTPVSLPLLQRKTLQRLAKLAKGKGCEDIKGNQKSEEIIEKLNEFYEDNEEEINKQFQLKKLKKEESSKGRKRPKISKKRIDELIEEKNHFQAHN
eukprot:TRINITY_DN2422_c0_g1_i1.p1 TRINITY_DN2422_c0_g1~~TRINITY_DN2422_c0_g1_i1.p1  ORF type:complete len:122 (-),score=34.60 TRINITY_DN2422_c0_g1_i1:49-414(-)